MIQHLLFLSTVSTLPLAAAAANSNKPFSTVVDDNRAVNPHAKTLFESDIERPLRYRPEGTDFVIENGEESFNRSLYGTNSPFRIDAGDKPEFGLYLPRRGGVLRLGIQVGQKSKWLHEADHVVARYRPGGMIYEIRDALLDNETIRLTALGCADEEGLVVKVDSSNAKGVNLIAAFGGANGDKGRTNVDLAAESVPVSQWWQLKPGHCKDNRYTIDKSTFLLESKNDPVAGTLSSDSELALGNAEKWNSLDELIASRHGSTTTPVLVATRALSSREPVYLALKRQPPGSSAKKTQPSDLTAEFEAAEKKRASIAEKIVVDTPDPFINAAASALCVAADGIWDGDKSQSWLHGAVAWRAPYLGWRGPYAGHALGWHDRSQAHFTYWAKRQLTSPATTKVGPDEKWNLARSQSSLMNSGMFRPTGSAAYDMNLVYIDALFRHLLWTGDLEFAKRMWPVVERHFEWEQRLFRREFTGSNGEKLPLYEGYCCIWGSDDLAYNGGGTTHSTAYNFYHNKIAAKLAALLGKDPSPYEREAELIAKGIREHLWLKDHGWFAEYKDWIGLQRTHDSPMLATFYHTLDSEVPSTAEASQMMRYVDTHLAHIPIKGPGVPNDRNYFTIPSSNWMPYSWSINNVVMAESVHTSLAYWQAGRTKTAFELFKGAILDSMFMGTCPGNANMTTRYDMGTGERYRDFGDAVGIASRTLIEGLFGITPDALSGELLIRPGFPADWDRASLRHPDLELGFKRGGLTEVYSVRPKFAKPMRLRLEAAALRNDIASVTVNGQPAKWTIDDASDTPRATITASAGNGFEVSIAWQGDQPAEPELVPAPPLPKGESHPVDWAKQVGGETHLVDLGGVFNDKVTQIFQNDYVSPRSPFASLSMPKHGYGNWCYPRITFEVDDSGIRSQAAQNQDRIVLPNGLALKTPGAADAKNIAFVSIWDNYPTEVSVPLAGKAARVYLLMTGSTNPMQSRIDNAEAVVTYTDGTTSRLPLHNPTTWWPIDQDYVIDDYAFRYEAAIPPRVDLKTGKIRIPTRQDLSKGPNIMIDGGAATVLNLPLDPSKDLQSLAIRALSNEVIVGLMSVTLQRLEPTGEKQ
ncbi:MAG: DUF4450 domain-containing protein [Luteolibacter sp.]